MDGASKHTLILLIFWRILSTLSHLFSYFDNFNNQFIHKFQFSNQINSHLLVCTLPITRPNFLKTPLAFTLSSPLIMLVKHRPFSPSPPLLFLNLNKIIRICSYNGYYKDRDINSALTHFPDSPINFNIKQKSKPLSYFFRHTNYLSYSINTSIYICPRSAQQPLINHYSS